MRWSVAAGSTVLVLVCAAGAAFLVTRRPLLAAPLVLAGLAAFLLGSP